MQSAAICLCIILLTLNFCLFLLSQLIYIGTFSKKRNDKGNTAPTAMLLDLNFPFISIHVPACDEPPELLCETLNYLARIDYPRFEVIVMDNNTPDEEVWRPIDRHCRALGNRFRFLHIEQLEGAKAGALNVCLAKTDPRAEYIAIVDADYQVDPHFLNISMEMLSKSNAAFVQFPQAFRGVERGSAAVSLELKDYFSFLAGDQMRSPLLTGTLSVIAVDALKQAGGWPTVSVTEDATLGVRLFRSGRRGLFVDEIVGRGVLPMSLNGLKKQRHRWICGNVQTLLGALTTRSATDRPITLSVLAQLLAWPAFWLGPMLFLFAAAFDREPDAATYFAVELSALTIVSSVLTAVFRGLVTRDRQTSVWRGIVGPLVVKCALIWVSSTAWLRLAIRYRIPFHRTPKSVAATRGVGANAYFGIVAMISAAAYLDHGDLLACFACALAALSWPAAIWVDRGLHRYGQDLVSETFASTDHVSTPCAA